VLFLFQAYIDVLLKPTFQPETEAILALEEPETHLHPHAARALTTVLAEVKAQKIISSHSPYYVQEVPFTDIRMFRRSGASSKVLYIKPSFSAKVPDTAQLQTFTNKDPEKFSYDATSTTLSITARMEEQEYRDLLQLYPQQPAVHQTLKELRDESRLFLSKTELADLYTYAKRIRGEVLFARGWILCEGQSEYLLIRYFADLLGVPLDPVGITVIDFQNNGSVGTFVGLARVFEIAWVMFCDNDQAGQKFVREAELRGLTPAELTDHARVIPGAGMDFERFLSHNGFVQEYAAILKERRVVTTKNPGTAGYEDEVAELVQKDKTGTALMLIEKMRASGAMAGRVPPFFETLIRDILRKAG
jgi:putative ATP-dependent endonuclease of OLD family